MTEEEHRKARRNFRVFMIVFVLGGGAAALFASSFIAGSSLTDLFTSLFGGNKPGFVQADLDNMKSSIKSELEKKSGTQVLEVVMLKESEFKAFGYAKVRLDGIGELTKACSATLEAEGRNYLWRCQ